MAFGAFFAPFFLSALVIAPLCAVVVAISLYEFRLRFDKGKHYLPDDDHLPAGVFFGLTIVAAAIVAFGLHNLIGQYLALGSLTGLIGGFVFSLPFALATRDKPRTPNEGYKTGMMSGAFLGMLILVINMGSDSEFIGGICFFLSHTLATSLNSAITYLGVDLASRGRNQVPKRLPEPDPRRVRLAELGKEIHLLELKRLETASLGGKLAEARRLEEELAAENPDPFRTAPVRR